MSHHPGASEPDREPTPSLALFRRLRGGASLRISASQCLRLRSRYSDCDQCARSCPPRVLRVSNESIELGDGCLRCGQCSAACPTGALTTEGFWSNRWHIAASRSPHYLDCWKVAASQSPDDAMRVPCLGGIAVLDLVGWHAASAGRPIVLLDRGWCGQCSAGLRPDHPAQETLNAARALLARLGAAEVALPRLESRPLPRTQMPAEIPDPPAAQPLSRREFFIGVARRARRAIAPAAAHKRAEAPRAHRAGVAKISASKRSQLMRHAAVLGTRYGRTVPVELFPALRVSDACGNHQVCAAVCPTGALRAYTNDDRQATGIVFEAAACIACADCARACPERALALVARGDGAVPSGARALTRWTLRECHDCGHEFADSGSNVVCPTCRKTRELALTDVSRLLSIAVKEPA